MQCCCGPEFNELEPVMKKQVVNTADSEVSNSKIHDEIVLKNWGFVCNKLNIETFSTIINTTTARV